jgi:hypothetical protein
MPSVSSVAGRQGRWKTREGCRHIGGRDRNEKGRGRVRVLSSPKFAPVAGPEHGTLRWLHAAAQAADFRARG